MAKCRLHGWIRTEILCRMVWSRSSLLSWRPFSCPNSVLCHCHLLPTPIPKNVAVTKTLAPKFCAECTYRRIHSSHGAYFREHFRACVSAQLSVNVQAISGQPLGNFQANPGQLSDDFWATLGQLLGSFQATFGQLSDSFRATFVASLRTDVSNGQKHQ